MPPILWLQLPSQKFHVSQPRLRNLTARGELKPCSTLKKKKNLFWTHTPQIPHRVSMCPY